MKLSKAKELIENGTHYVSKDVDNIDLAQKLSENVFNLTNIIWNEKYDIVDMKKINLSEITDDEEIVYQFKDFDNVWKDFLFEVRIKPKPDFSKELEALNKKANENNMKVIVTFENS